MLSSSYSYVFGLVVTERTHGINSYMMEILTMYIKWLQSQSGSFAIFGILQIIFHHDIVAVYEDLNLVTVTIKRYFSREHSERM